MRKILIADDSLLNRTVLRNILEAEYEVLEAVDGRQALEFLHREAGSLAAILLDVVMPEADGYEVLEAMGESVALTRIPVIICGGTDDAVAKERAYALGAAGFLPKPYNPAVILNSLHNIIRICEMAAVRKTVMNDDLTGLMTGEAFFLKVAGLVAESRPDFYVLECVDIDNFKLINNLYGVEEGNCILRQTAEEIRRMCEHIGGVCGHIYADNFAMLYPNNPDAGEYVTVCREALCASAHLQGEITVSAGRYVISDPTLSPSAMYDLACIAKHSVKGKYDRHVAYFDDSMLHALLQSQFITSDMNKALGTGQFEVWLQPQFNHATGKRIGAEALVRWRHPERGLIPPCEFIPVFEQSGFIYELDKYVWEQVCILLRRWTDEGKNPQPISVNLSRCEILKEDLTGVICGLTEKYSIPSSLLRLEITESAFASSTEKIVSVVRQLKALGFTVEIDDFGSGYSSLNTLKSVPADVIKLDMRFLQDEGDSRRGGSIIESVVRMVKWLGMSVLAEGVETTRQADFLKTVGCYYVQGYLYAKPMPACEYEIFAEKCARGEMSLSLGTVENLDSNAFWDPASMETLIFNSYVGGASIIEYHGGVTEPIRVNDRFMQEFAGAFKDGVPLSEIAPEKCMDRENLEIMHRNIDKAIATNRESTCEVVISELDGGRPLYLRCTVRAIAWTGDRHLLYCVVTNITAQRISELKQRDMYSELLDNLPCGAGLYEFDGKQLRVIHLNHQYWTLVSKPPQSTEGVNALDALHPEDRARFLPEISDAILQKRDAVFEARIHGEREDYFKFHIVVRIGAKKGESRMLYAFFMPSSEGTAVLEEQNRRRRDKNRLDFILKNAAISVWSYNLRTGEIIQNERSRAMHGFGTVIKGVPESLVDCGFVHPDSVQEYLAMYQKLRDGAKEAEGVFRVKTADGAGYWFEHLRCAAVTDGGERGETVLGISSDVSAEYEQEHAIHQWMELISDMQVEKNAICEFNLTKNVFVRKQGNLFPAFDFQKNDPFDAYVLAWVRQCVYAGDAEKVVDYLNRDKLLDMHARGLADGGMDYRAALDGGIRWCSLSVKFIRYPTDDDVRLIMVHSDIDARKLDELRLIEENRRDPLTGVLNRKAFERQVDRILTSSPSAIHALFMIDLDNFKSINDAFGHMTGDTVLKKTADGLRSLLREDDLVGRIGGDEFMVFLRNIPNRSVIRHRAQMILEMMRAVLDADVKLSGSLGIAIAPRDGDNFEQLYRCADKAAYYSKQHGKNCSTFFNEEFGEASLGDGGQEGAESDAALRVWDERAREIMAENQRLIERQEEDERYRLVIESTHTVTFEYRAQTGKFAASPGFYEYVLSDQDGDRLFSENVDVSGIHPDDRALFYGKFLEKVLGGESAQETSLRLALRVGGYRWCRLGALVDYDRAERLQKGIGIITVENVQKNRPDVQLDAIFKYMSAGVLILAVKKPEIKTLFVSESYYRLENTGDVASPDVLRFVHSDDLTRLRDNLFICALSGAVMEETYRVTRAGRTFWRHMHAVRIPYPDETDPVMIAVETDITDVKLREQRLLRRWESTSAALAALDIVSWNYDPAKKTATLTSTGLPGHPAVLMRLPKQLVEDGTVHPDDADRFCALFAALNRGEIPDHIMIRIRVGADYEARKIRFAPFTEPDGHTEISCISEPVCEE